MNYLAWTALAAVSLFAGPGAISMRAQQSAPDLILSNGKIITVDDRFTIAQAVAVRGDRASALTRNDRGLLVKMVHVARAK